MKNRSGFSLVELAMVLAISGLMVGFMVQANRSNNSAKCYETSKEQVKTISAAVERFARKNDKLPLPAARNIGVEDINYGREAAPAAITQFAAAVGTVSVGALPFQALGLPVAMASDCWGNKLTYMVTTELTDTTGFLNTSLVGNIELKSSTTVTVTNTIAYAIISHGEDQLGAVKNNYSGVSLGWCTAVAPSTMRNMNCRAAQAEVASGPLNNGKDAGANYFDDVVLASGRPQILDDATQGNLYCWGYNGNGQLGNGGTANSLVPVAVSLPTGVTSFSSVVINDGNVNNSCAIANTGQVYCWGANAGWTDFMAVGDSNNRTVPSPVLTPAGHTYSSIYKGYDYTCATKSDTKDLYCWGYENNGEFSTSTYTGDIGGPVGVPYWTYTTALFAQIPVPFTFTKIAGAGDNICGLGSDGKIYCWGANPSLTRGNGGVTEGDNTPRLITMPSGVISFTDVDAEYQSACAIANTGRVYCWGYNGDGQLGNGVDTSDSNIPLLVALPTGVDAFTSIKVGGAVSCGLANTGVAYCWGRHNEGALGNGAMANSYVPVAVTMPVGVLFTSLDVTGTTACALGDDSRTYCWGYNADGQVGDGSTTNRAVPTAVSNTGSGASELNFKSITTGPRHACGIVHNNSNMWCWGKNDLNQLGDGTIETATRPVRAALPTGVNHYKQMAHGNAHTCAIGDNGLMYCWGLNDNGQFGDGTTTNSDVPVATVLPAGVTSFTHVAAGNTGHTCALANTRRAYCWGANGFGELGNAWASSGAGSGDPVVLPAGVTGFTSIYAGTYVSCAIGDDEKTYCWGYGANGQMGNGSTTADNNVPVEVNAPAAGVTYKKIAVGGFTVCGIGSNGLAYCWGLNSAGELGNGNNTDSTTPVQVTLPTGVKYFVDIDIEYHTVCAIADNGRAYCWGNNSFGMLGNGTAWVNSNVPLAVTLPTGVTAFKSISVGFRNVCATGNNDVNYCWGYGTEGAVGNDDTAGSDVPVPVSKAGGIPNFSVMDSGGDFNCGLVLPKTNAYAWGDNAYSRLGDNTTTNRNVPTQLRSDVKMHNIVVGGRNACGIGSDGYAYCWGNNTNGDWGHYNQTEIISKTPTRVASGFVFSKIYPTHVMTNATCALTPFGEAYCWSGLAPTPTLVSAGLAFDTLSNGSGFLCGTTADGRGYCWGTNAFGQLGDGSTTDSPTPNPVSGRLRFRTLVAGDSHTCGITISGDAYCWGDNNGGGSNGKLGDGTSTDRLVPTAVVGGHKFQNIQLSVEATFGLTTGGQIYRWGTGDLSPVLISDEHVFTKMMASWYNVCATKADNSLWCWGYNPSGELGNGDPNAWPFPLTFTQVTYSGSADLAFGNLSNGNVAGGENNFAALTKGSNAVCSGNNDRGQLGDGTNINSLTLQSVKLPGDIKLRRISSGTYQSCGIGDNGMAYCWGNGDFWNLGDNRGAHSNTPSMLELPAGVTSFTDIDVAWRGNGGWALANTGQLYTWGEYTPGGFTPVLVAPVAFPPGVTGFIDVSSGYGAVHAIGNNGRLYALGFNHHGDFGNGTSGGFENGFWTETNMPAGVDSFTAVDSAQYYTCAIANTRQVYCWGRNDGCNIGDGICGPIVSVPTSPVMPSEVTGVREISTAGNTCAIADNGRPYCWGFGASWAPTLPAPVTMPAGVTSFSNINAGGDITCALANTGKTYCWGFTTYGSAEYPDTPFIPNVFANGTTSDSATPVAAFEPYTNALSALSIGETHSCAISLPKTNTYCAGTNTYGQLGSGNRISSSISQPTLLPNGVKLRTIAEYGDTACGIGEDNQAYCWGATGNASGYNRLGNGGSATSPTAFDIPVKVTLPTGTTGFTHIDVGNGHTCAIANTGSIYCWGSNAWGRLGTNTFTWLNTREPVNEATKPAGVNYFTELSLNASHSCALGDNGGAYCWGLNFHGTLGDGTTTDRDEPTAVTLPVGVSSWTSVSAGLFHSCALADTGRVYCWGEGSNGEFGNGATVNTTAPAVAANLPAGVTAYTKVTAAQHFTCALGNNGRAYCWGMGWNGQLGHGANAAVSTPVAVSLPTGVTSFKDIKGKNYSACAIGNNNRTYCWGLNGNGQFGDSTLTSSNVPVPAHTLSTLNPITQIAIDGSKSCAISYAKSNLHCAGYNGSGNFANGSFSYTPAYYNTAAILPPGVTGYKYITAGSQWEPYHTCAIANTNDLYCWGGNSHGQLAQGTSGADNNSSVPLLVSVPSGARYFTEVSAGFGNATCALADTGRVYCWAQVDLGDGFPHGQGAPVDPAIFPPGVTAYTTVSATNGSACAVGNDGVTYCWGNGGDGIRGDGTTSNASSPTAVTMPANTIFKEIIAGGNYHRCALTAQGKAYCWGQGANGKLGNGSTADSSVPVPVTLPAGVNFFRQLALGDPHTCGIADNNRIYCWGGDSTLGNGLGADSSVPVPITMPAGVTGFHSISARGTYSTCAVANDNQTYCWGYSADGYFGNGRLTFGETFPILSHAPSALTTPTIPLVAEGYSCVLSNVPKTFCWGRNNHGQLGNGTSGVTPADRPGSILLPAGVQWFSKVVSNSMHTCALGNNSRAYCWGDNTNGKLGDNSTTNSLSPIAVSMPGGVVFTDITAGMNQTCALGDNGTAYCWGAGAEGAIGDSANSDRDEPTAVTFPVGVTSFARIGSGANHTCALGNDGQVYCWGDNAEGQLGDNTTTDRNLPTLAILPGGVTSFIDLAVGYNHSCAIADTGGLYCWGDNAFGTIGDGSAVDSLVPTVTTLPGGVTAFTSVSAGYRHTCAIGNNARAYCWGEGDWGAIGNGTNNAANYDTPTLVDLPTGTTSYKSVIAGASYSCGITNDKRTFCWGYNGYSALGDDSTTTRLVPTEVYKAEGMSEFQSIASHGETTCAIGVP